MLPWLTLGGLSHQALQLCGSSPFFRAFSECPGCDGICSRPPGLSEMVRAVPGVLLCLSPRAWQCLCSYLGVCLWMSFGHVLHPFPWKGLPLAVG